MMYEKNPLHGQEHLATQTALMNSSNGLVHNNESSCDPDEKLWYIFFLSSIFSFAGAFAMVSCGRCISYAYSRHSERANNQHKVTDQSSTDQPKSLLTSTARHADIGCVTAAKDWAGELISGQTNSGRILVSDSTAHS